MKSLEAVIPYYEDVLGLVCEGREEVESQKVRTAFFAAGDVHIELLEPTSDESPIAKFIEKNGEGIHHIAFATDDMYARGWADVETHWRAFLTYVAGAVYDGESCFTVACSIGSWTGRGCVC